MKVCLLVSLMMGLPVAAQAPSKVAYQAPGWIGTSGSTAVTVHVNRPDGQTGPVIGEPFSGVEIRSTVQTLSDGTHVNHTDTDKFYRDSQGRMRSDSSTKTILYDPVAGYTYTINLQAKSYYQTPIRPGVKSTSIAVDGDSTWIKDTDTNAPSLPYESARLMRDGKLPMHTEPLKGVDDRNLGEKDVNGVSCVGKRITMTIPAGTFGNDRDIRVVNERWYSESLQVLVKSSNSDPRFGVTTYELTQIKQGNPDPQLFRLPSGYAVKDFGH